MRSGFTSPPVWWNLIVYFLFIVYNTSCMEARIFGNGRSPVVKGYPLPEYHSSPGTNHQSCGNWVHAVQPIYLVPAHLWYSGRGVGIYHRNRETRQKTPFGVLPVRAWSRKVKNGASQCKAGNQNTTTNIVQFSRPAASSSSMPRLASATVRQPVEKPDGPFGCKIITER